MSGLHRRDVLKTAFAARGDALAISGLGSATWDLASLGDRDDNFYLWGAMGNAAMIGLGLARARPDKRVVVGVADNDAAELVFGGAGVTLEEGGSAGSYTLVLRSEPTDDVVVTITPGAYLR